MSSSRTTSCTTVRRTRRKPRACCCTRTRVCKVELAEAEYAEEFFEAAIPDASPLPWPSPMLSGSALPCPFRGDYQRCRIPFMVRTTVLHLLLGGIFRFSTSSHPEALEACYVALWRLPRPDSHRLADSDFQGTPASAREWRRMAMSHPRNPYL